MVRQTVLPPELSGSPAKLSGHSQQSYPSTPNRAIRALPTELSGHSQQSYPGTPNRAIRALPTRLSGHSQQSYPGTPSILCCSEYTVLLKDLLEGRSSVAFIIEPRHDKTCLREFPTRPDTNRTAQPQKLARVLKLRLWNLEILYCLSSEQQRR